MASGEYVSVSSQADTEKADLAREQLELATDGEAEYAELAAVYVKRGVDPAVARQVAEQLMANDALGAHAREELGFVSGARARPIQAALTSAATFTVGAAMPLLAAAVSPRGILITVVAVASLLFLALLGTVGARAGGAKLLTATARVTFWGAFAMATTAVVGAIFGATV